MYNSQMQLNYHLILSKIEKDYKSVSVEELITLFNIIQYRYIINFGCNSIFG